MALPGFPLVASGDDLAAYTAAALTRAALELQAGDVLVFAQKVVSKAEGRWVDLRTVTPSARALELALTVEKDARLVELVLRESQRIVRAAKDVLIVEHRLGLIMANAGIDQSNVTGPAGQPNVVGPADQSYVAGPSGQPNVTGPAGQPNVVGPAGGDVALLLPEDPDASAARLREQLFMLTGCAPGIVISDSFGRPWRVGTVGVAIGCAGFPATLDLRGQRDLAGRVLRVTVVGHADEVASAASILMGQGSEALPVVLVRGLTARAPQQSASALLRPPHEDLFR